MPADPITARARGRRARTLATLAPLFGLFLLTPPVVLIFAVEGAVLGLPLIAVYIFAVWGALILSARAIARAVSRALAAAEEDDR